MKRKKIKAGWKEYFNFSARERRGSMFLSLIILVLICVLYFVRNLPNDFPLPDEKIIQAFLLSVNDSATEKIFSKNVTSEIKSKKLLFSFNPNSISDSDGVKLGLTQKQTDVIQNYISKGGKFKIKKDFKKMYCISDAQYQELEPFIQLPETLIYFAKENRKKEVKNSIVDIVTADSVELVGINGIGPVLASRIIKFREKLGGFYASSQLKEVYGITDSLFDKISSQIFFSDTIPFRFIHVNKDSFDLLASHPYIRYKVAGIICKFRSQHQTINSIDEIKAMPLISEENFRKLAPYIRLD